MYVWVGDCYNFNDVIPYQIIKAKLGVLLTLWCDLNMWVNTIFLQHRLCLLYSPVYKSYPLERRTLNVALVFWYQVVLQQQ